VSSFTRAKLEISVRLSPNVANLVTAFFKTVLPNYSPSPKYCC
jgi:hypothetical protein